MTLKTGLIGCGVWGERILADLLSLGAEVTVVDTDADRCLDLERRFPVKVVRDLEAMGRVDGTIVATPASTHADVLARLDRFGVPIFVEKPLTDDPETARGIAMQAACEIFVMHVWHYHPGIRLLARLAQDAELGAVHALRTVRVNWTSPRTDVDSVWTLVPHDLSIAQAVLGHIPEPVFAQAELRAGKAVGMLAVLGKAAPQVIIDTSTRYRDKRREVRLHCEAGVAVLPDDRSGMIEIDREGEPGSGGEREVRRFAFEPPLLAELSAFLGYLAGGPPPPTGLDDGIEVVETIGKLRKLAGLPARAG